MGILGSKSATTQEFLKTRFSSKPSESYNVVNYNFRQSGWASSKKVVEKATGDTYVAEYWNKVVSDKEVDDLARIYQVFKKLNHPNLVKLHQVFKLSKQKYVFVTSNYQETDLFDVIVEKTEKSEMTEQEAAKYTHQFLMAIQHLHQLDIVHRDIKPENAYFHDPERTKIILHPGPFCTEPGNASDLNKPCGTLAYLAPEIANRKEYGKAVDCWSLGVTVYVMLSGGMPFIATSEPDTLELVKKAEYELKPEYWGSRSDEAKDFVRSLMTVDPDQRMNCDQALKHPWITKHIS